MLVISPPVKTEQNGSIRIQNLAEVVVRRLGFRLTEKRSIPIEAARDISDTNDCPCAFHLSPRV
jgi:hypothetical protein